MNDTTTILDRPKADDAAHDPSIRIDDIVDSIWWAINRANYRGTSSPLVEFCDDSEMPAMVNGLDRIFELFHQIEAELKAMEGVCGLFGGDRSCIQDHRRLHEEIYDLNHPDDARIPAYMAALRTTAEVDIRGENVPPFKPIYEEFSLESLVACDVQRMGDDPFHMSRSIGWSIVNSRGFRAIEAMEPEKLPAYLEMLAGHLSERIDRHEFTELVMRYLDRCKSP